MKFTGRQLFEMWAWGTDPSWDWESPRMQEKFNALADKVNGMMAGEPEDPDRCRFDDTDRICARGTLHCYVKHLDADRARHHATCPYRHGKGSCSC